MTEKERQYLKDYLSEVSYDECVLYRIYDAYSRELRLYDVYENTNENLGKYFGTNMKDFLNLVDARYSDYDPDCSWFYVDEDNYSITSSETLKEALDKMCNDDFIGTILDSYDALGDLTSDKLLETAILDAKVSKAVGEEERSL